MKKLFAALCVGSLLFQLACSDSNQGSAKEDTEKYLTYGIVYLSAIWQKVTVADVDPSFTYNGLTPSCACPPSYQATTKKTATYNPEFAFFVKRGSVNNLLIFFMGGGACWDITNCAYNHTYSEQLIESNLLLGLGTTGFLEGQGVGGIMDTKNPDNPFKDWTMVWIPYCTADLGMGQKDNTYPDHYGSSYTDVTIRHRGLVNVKMVLQWLQTNIKTSPDKLFVTGVSAGSYAALLNYPRIREIFPSPTKGYMLGDAGVGVTGIDSGGHNFFQVVENLWLIALPDQIPNFSGKKMSDFANYKSVFHEISNFYSGDKFAQYTTKWDKTQVWFYYIQSDNNINLPENWGAEEDAPSFSTYSNNWNTSMSTLIAIGDINYRYFISPGTKHTVLLFPDYYTVESGGVLFSDWLKDFIDDKGVSNQDCASCPAP
jgi:hypothetical protein